MEQKSMVFRFLIIIVALVVGYFVGYSIGDGRGYKRAEADIQKLGAAAGERATKEAAKAANPFQAVNPLEQVEANPFEKAKKILNPFE